MGPAKLEGHRLGRAIQRSPALGLAGQLPAGERKVSLGLCESSLQPLHLAAQLLHGRLKRECALPGDYGSGQPRRHPPTPSPP
eukprot:scaffold31240_cov37-Tisochrysis_lutea.AAC.2